MPVYNLNVEVKEMSPEIEKDLSQIGTIRGKIGYLKLYFLDVEVPIGTSLEIAAAYLKKIGEIEEKHYVTSVKEATEMEVLRNNRIALDVGIRLETEKLRTLK